MLQPRSQGRYITASMSTENVFFSARSVHTKKLIVRYFIFCKRDVRGFDHPNLFLVPVFRFSNDTGTERLNNSKE